MNKAKNNKNQIGRILWGVLSYLLAVIACMIFALFCSARVGWFLLTVVVGAPILSVIWSYVCSFFVEAELETGCRLLEIGNMDTVLLKVGNRSIIPVPEIIVYFEDNGRIVSDSVEDNNSFSIRGLFRVENSSEIKIKALYCGLAEMRIKKISVRGFFGLVEIPVKMKKSESVSIGILPRNTELEFEEEWLLETRTAAMEGKEPEDSLNDSGLGFGGFPGYDHREYVPGDPLKRINYKLSARTGSLMVRLDEQYAVAGITMVLLAEKPEAEPAQSLIFTSHCLDMFMEVARHLYMLDFSVTISLPDNEMFDIRNGESLEMLREKLAMVKFYTVSQSNLSFQIPDEGSVIIITPVFDSYCAEICNNAASSKNISISVYDASTERGMKM